VRWKPIGESEKIGEGFQGEAGIKKRRFLFYEKTVRGVSCLAAFFTLLLGADLCLHPARIHVRCGGIRGPPARIQPVMNRDPGRATEKNAEVESQQQNWTLVRVQGCR
jgi:hypothetical protein